MSTTIDEKLAQRMLWAMAAGRRLEEREAELFSEGTMVGLAHLGVGEEGAFVGGVAALREGDALLPTQRGISGVIMKGVPLSSITGEMLGRATGAAKGRGGVIHVASTEHSVIGMSGTVGAQFPIALGYGLAIRRRGGDEVVLCCFGDGTFNRGTFHEAVNMMALWKSPVVLLCDNNLYATSVPFSAAHPLPRISDRVAGYAVPATCVDGNDAVAVHDAVRSAVERARGGEGPQLVEALTYRWRGHYEGDQAQYRPEGELEEWQERDPIPRFSDGVQKLGLLSEADCEATIARAHDDVEQAITEAIEAPLPEPEDAFRGLFVEPGAS